MSRALMSRERIPQTTEDRICELTREGWVAYRIAQECGVSSRTVTRVRSRNGVRGKVGKPSKEIPKDQMILAEALLEDGASYRDVAETTGIPRTSLRGMFPGKGFSVQDTANLATSLPRLPERLRWSLVRNRND